MTTALDSAALDQLFRTARTRNGWSDRPVPDALLRELYDLLKWAPTSANASPARFLFLTTAAAKSRLAPFLSTANRGKTMAAPVTAIIGYDLAFAETSSPPVPTRADGQGLVRRAGTRAHDRLPQRLPAGRHLIIAARALGLGCGPMSGFDSAGVDGEFFLGTTVRSNFICSLGYGTDENLFARNPRLSFDEACRIL
jgi:3-hydroxypropanoate dehydrogenase